MLDEGELLAALEPALLVEGSLPGKLAVARRIVRRRSSIYVVGVENAGSVASSWVVKRPSVEGGRLGIRGPMDAAGQYAALQRLYDFLATGDPRFTAPRPVALLPELEALVMEFVQGRSVWDLAVPSALLRPAALREGVRTAALALRHLHTNQPRGTEPVDLAEVEAEAEATSRGALQSIGVQVRDGWYRRSGQRSVPGKLVLLHGDWAPENVLLDHEKVYLLDPELTDYGWPEHDLARFLLMLWDRSIFVGFGALQGSRRLRHDLTSIFLTTYYGYGEPVSPLLRPLLLREVSQRWAVRHQGADRGSAPALQARVLLLRQYFGGLVAEVTDPRRSTSLSSTS
jgi:aminoglycoside phosphotransferase (APT) family kinase protein